MSTLYVAMICDRHSDPEPFLFVTAEAAIKYARRCANENAWDPANVEETEIDGWLYYATYSVEGDRVWVLEKEVDPREEQPHDR